MRFPKVKLYDDDAVKDVWYYQKNGTRIYLWKDGKDKSTGIPTDDDEEEEEEEEEEEAEGGGDDDEDGDDEEEGERKSSRLGKGYRLTVKADSKKRARESGAGAGSDKKKGASLKHLTK